MYVLVMVDKEGFALCLFTLTFSTLCMLLVSVFQSEIYFNQLWLAAVLLMQTLCCCAADANIMALSPFMV